MFSPEVNDTHFPGLHGRLIHDLVDPSVTGFDHATVNALWTNVHCSQVSDAVVQTLISYDNSTSTTRSNSSSSSVVTVSSNAAGLLANPYPPPSLSNATDLDALERYVESSHYLFQQGELFINVSIPMPQGPPYITQMEGAAHLLFLSEGGTATIPCEFILVALSKFMY